MPLLYDQRRYLTTFDSRRTPNLYADVLIIGSGVAGLRAAIEAAGFGHVLVVTKGRLDESNTAQAQGGVAVALPPKGDPQLHLRDTLEVGCGLCNEAIVRHVVYEGPARIQELIDWGARFDKDPAGQLDLTREGGHSTHRILHAAGDATGREVLDTLLRRARQDPQTRFFENCYTIDLVSEDDACLGAVTYHPTYGHQLLWAQQTILASGGAGQLYRETSNSPMATGDGLAMAYRAGATLSDLEFIQFHPTTLYVAGASRALISEAVRGEGARLVDRDGVAFMAEYHPDADLAPRDVVSRAILERIIATGATNVFLDVSPIGAARFGQRFPGIARLCEQFDVDLHKGRIPVRPSAHYMIGGVLVDLEGRTNIRGLLVCGEAAANGLHGANRLASNSLLEGLVFGASCGRLAGQAIRTGGENPRRVANDVVPKPRTELDLADIRHSLRHLMARNVGITRSGQRLDETVDILEFWGRYVMDKVFDDPPGWQLQNMLSLARLMAVEAGRREESRGVHYRKDCPERNDADWQVHLTVQRTPAGQLQHGRQRAQPGGES